ncbi:MAG: hypothetical protein KatS3mg087_0449 [Patescibacteria group bacterium]|nr:MAG: hypothetical protein KatS3mg087_0449 [Patescibacteria group bacterium]
MGRNAQNEPMPCFCCERKNIPLSSKIPLYTSRFVECPFLPSIFVSETRLTTWGYFDIPPTPRQGTETILDGKPAQQPKHITLAPTTTKLYHKPNKQIKSQTNKNFNPQHK